MKALEVSATLVGKLRSNEGHTATQPAANGDTGPVASVCCQPDGRAEVVELGEVTADNRGTEGPGVSTWYS